MIPRLLVVAILLSAAWPALCQAKVDGHWMRKVPVKDHARANPFADDTRAVQAGAILFRNHCAQCHGDHAQGKGSHPSLLGSQVRIASDGDLFWVVKNGVPYRGMPRWASLPKPKRWQIIAYIRSLNPGPTTQPSADSKAEEGSAR